MDNDTEKRRRKSNETAYNITPPLIGSKLPAMTAKTVDSKLFDLNRAIKNKPTILLFYRGHW
ncbi:hypothetical protein KKC82_06835 [bacterium]|nr:hypothetical protein [bacterium]